MCDAVWQGFDFTQNKWGDREEAVKFIRECEKNFDGLRLYPFVRRFYCRNATQYRRAVDQGLQVTEDAPELVPPVCWDYLFYKVRFADFYAPKGTNSINQGHRGCGSGTRLGSSMASLDDDGLRSSSHRRRKFLT